MSNNKHSLKNIPLLAHYATNRNNLALEFFSPCLEESIQYNRAVGYFRSSIFIISNQSIIEFAKRGGHIGLICSPQMAKEDIEAIQKGYDKRQKIGELLQLEIEEALESSKGRPVIELLATLIATNCLEIRIAFCPKSLGIFHDKVGLFIDKDGNAISFTGSLNETFSGWDTTGNHESFDVFCSWTSENARVELHRNYFLSLWDGNEPGVEVLSFPTVAREKLIDISNSDGVEAAYLKTIASSSSTKILFPHQIKAIESWKQSGYRGILQHATGSGKTFTAISAIREFISRGQPIIILVPSELLVDQWYREIRQELSDFDFKILRAGGGHTSWKNSSVVEVYSSQEGGPRITIATIQTASSEEFLQRIKGGSHLVIIIDEVHRAGSKNYSKVFTINSGPRLGLSATPYRYGDQEGTSKIMGYFIGIIEPPFTLYDAIKAGRLCKYTYHVHEVPLSDHELQQWTILTEKIKNEYARSVKDDNGKKKVSDSFKLLLIKRARIIKQATSKIGIAVEIIQKYYKMGHRWLIYCDTQNQLKMVSEELRKAGFENDEYRSSMIGDKEATLDYFKTLGGIIVAIKCLDEGIDIPLIDHALILASSKNPREFIQRRGRVLRKAPDKFTAEIHDTIVLPTTHENETFSFVRTELSRALQFAEMSMNNSVKLQLRSIAFDHGLDPDELMNYSEVEGLEEEEE